MLVLSRKTKQQILIGENIVVTIVQVKGQTVRVGIEAPRDVRVVRGEIASLPVEAADEAPAGKSSMSRPERIEAGRNGIDPGFSSPLVGCASLVGESSGLYPFVRRRGTKGATTSRLAVLQG